jgi:hypothetical protein
MILASSLANRSDLAISVRPIHFALRNPIANYGENVKHK